MKVPTARNDHNIPFSAVSERTAKVLWRDFFFLLLGSVALLVISYVETNAPNAQSRGFQWTQDSAEEPKDDTPMGSIVDTGFLLTTPLYEFLAKNRDWNDLLAALNSLALIIPSLYVTYVTVWKGDYSLVFRVLFTQLLRSFCGWFTYLPPVSSYLTSYYDFPDIVHCLYQDCSGSPKVLPFVSFFSGHVCTMVLAGNHMWLKGHTTLAVLVHLLDVFQIVRLLATRGHYSIDIIIGWYMAVNVSNGAGRLGRYYSRGKPMNEILPANAAEAFETVTGVSDVRNETRLSKLLKEDDVRELLLQLHDDESTTELTTLRMIHMNVEYTARLIHERIQRFGEDSTDGKIERTKEE